MSLIQNTAMEQQMHVITKSDGKNLTIPDGMRAVKIPEKREGKGKGKTIACVTLPLLNDIPVDSDSLQLLKGMILANLQELQQEICVSKARAGATHILSSDISLEACVAHWSSKEFSSESIANWYDSEMSLLLGTMICASKGWQEDALTAEQNKYVEQKNAAYRASYIACADKFPKLNASQMQELLRVMNLAECTGYIPDRIRQKIEVKKTEEALGF